MDLRAAISGDLAKMMGEEVRIAERAGTSAINRAAGGIQRELRRQTKRAGLGSNVEKAWRREQYPKRGRSLGAASLVFSKATRIHEAFSAARTIVARRARWLVIPLQPAISRGWDRGFGRSASTSQPRKFANVEAAQRSLGRLAFVPVDGSTALLVHRRQGTSEAYFLLVRKVRTRKVFDFERTAAKWQAKVPGYIATAYERANRRAGR